MFVETARLKREGLKGKKLAKSMAAKFSSYSAEELRVFAELVPSPELRRGAKAVHSLLLALLCAGSITAALSAHALFSEGDRSPGLVLAGMVLLSRSIPIAMVARYRRDGGVLVLYGAAMGLLHVFRGTTGGGALGVVNLAFMVVLAGVAWLWIEKLFPKLTWRGQLR